MRRTRGAEVAFLPLRSRLARDRMEPTISRDGSDFPRTGKMDLERFLRKRRMAICFVWDESTIYAAAVCNGHEECLRYMMEAATRCKLACWLAL